MQITLPQIVKTWFGNRDEVQHPHKRYHDEDWHTPKGRQIREVVFGMNDGLVSTVGFVAGVTGSINNSRIVFLTGMAAMIAGAVSMFLGAYLASKSQKEFFEREIEREKREIIESPEKERQEIRDIFTDHGFTEDEVEMIVHRVTSDKDRWIKFMMRDELGIVDEDFDNPVKVGVIMGISFIIGGLPLIFPFAFIHDSMGALKFSIALALAILLGLGIGKTVLTRTHWLKSSAETVLLGSLAAGIGYIFGRIFSVAV
ncbi:MAG: VIT1/CCC1 transporter family protein [Nitrospirae bacterium]|nr:VIT1/CCC1 transporter family protein [Nitrospirota bacterium]